MADIKAQYYRFNGTDWDRFYFETTADMIVETETYKVLTADERFAISRYLSEFNTSNNLVKLDITGKIDNKLIPNLKDTYLSLADGGEVVKDVSFLGWVDINRGLAVYTRLSVAGDLEGPSPNTPISVVNDMNLNGKRIKNLGDPTDGKDAATKDYVDVLVSTGVRPIESVRLATTTNMTLSGVGTKIDGVTYKEGDRILVHKQSDPSKNGIYIARSSSWTRIDSDSRQGAYVFVEEGDTYNDYYFFCQDEHGTWVVHGRPDTVKAGLGLYKEGTTLNISPSGVTNNMLDGNISPSKLADFMIDLWGSKWEDVIDPNGEYGRLSLKDHITNIYRILILLRGRGMNDKSTDAVNESIKGAYEAIKELNRTYYGTSLPSNSSDYNLGDVYFVKVNAS